MKGERQREKEGKRESVCRGKGEANADDVIISIFSAQRA